MKREFGCAVELALAVLGGKWRVVILAHVKDKPLRYSELRRRIPNMSEKILSQRLRELSSAGLLKHDAGTYGLTARGKRARKALGELHAWGTTLEAELGVRIVPSGGAGSRA